MNLHFAAEHNASAGSHRSNSMLVSSQGDHSRHLRLPICVCGSILIILCALVLPQFIVDFRVHVMVSSVGSRFRLKDACNCIPRRYEDVYAQKLCREGYSQFINATNECRSFLNYFQCTSHVTMVLSLSAYRQKILLARRYTLLAPATPKNISLKHRELQLLQMFGLGMSSPAF